jgi:hypothetical protein
MSHHRKRIVSRELCRFVIQYYSNSMKRTYLRGLVILQLVLAADLAMLCAQPKLGSSGVTGHTNRTLIEENGQWTVLEDEITMAGAIKVFTNGTFQVNEGKVRHLQERQILRPDGNELNPDGSIVPVVNHIAMIGAGVVVFKDGESEALKAPLVLPDDTVINPDGNNARPYGRRSRLMDGQQFTLAGAPIPGLDTISL